MNWKLFQPAHRFVVKLLLDYNEKQASLTVMKHDAEESRWMGIRDGKNPLTPLSFISKTGKIVPTSKNGWEN